jgi:hypothetical protein
MSDRTATFMSRLAGEVPAIRPILRAELRRRRPGQPI